MVDSLIEKLFGRAFREKVVLDEVEYYKSVRMISKDMAMDMLKEMEAIGLVEVVKKGRGPYHIYNKKRNIV